MGYRTRRAGEDSTPGHLAPVALINLTSSGYGHVVNYTLLEFRMLSGPRAKIRTFAFLLLLLQLGPRHSRSAAEQPAMWTSIGPMPIENGETGRVPAVAVDPSDSNHWLIGAATGGIWESRDAGKRWVPRTDQQPTLATGSIAFAPGSPKTVYAGTGELGFSRDALAGLGLLKSVDGGTNWTL